MQLGDHKELIAWKKSMDLVVLVYTLTTGLPVKESCGLSSQMQRAAVSIPSNIAEGRRRHSMKEARHFLSIAFGSAAELETQIEIAKRLRYGDHAIYSNIESLLNEVLKMLNKMSG